MIQKGIHILFNFIKRWDEGVSGATMKTDDRVDDPRLCDPMEGAVRRCRMCDDRLRPRRDAPRGALGRGPRGRGPLAGRSRPLTVVGLVAPGAARCQVICACVVSESVLQAPNE